MLIRSVEKFLRQHEMAATKYGRLAAHDPRQPTRLQHIWLVHVDPAKRCHQLWAEQRREARPGQRGRCGRRRARTSKCPIPIARARRSTNCD